MSDTIISFKRHKSRLRLEMGYIYYSQILIMSAFIIDHTRATIMTTEI